MATGFSVFVKIGGKLDGSLSSAVKGAEAQVQGLAQRLARIGHTMQTPFRALQTHIDATAKSFKKIQDTGRNLTLGVTAPGAFAAKRGYDTVLGFEKEMNKVKAYGELSDDQKRRVEDNARSIAKTGVATAKDVAQMTRRYIQAGRDVDQAIGMTKPTIDFAIFGDVDPAKAADVVTSVASAYQMPLKTLEEAQSTATRIGDVLAKGANISRADVKDFAEGFKYAAPFAARAGVSVEQLAAAIATMNQKGIPGAEAGVAMRSMLVRMVKPTADAQTAMASLGMSFEQFVEKWKKFSMADLQSTLAQKGINIGKLGPKLDKSINGLSLAEDHDAIRKKLTDGIVGGLGLKPRDGKVVAKAINSYVMGLADEINVEGMIKALEEKGVSLGQVARMFDARQGARLSTLFQDKEFFELLDKLQKESAGSSARGSKTMLEGLPGAHNRFLSGVENVLLSLAKSGVIDTVTDGLNRIAESLNRIAAANPETLKIGAGFAAAALAAGPLLLALGAIGRVGALALSAVNKAAALLVWPLRAAAGAATLLRGALLLTGVGAALVGIAAAGTWIYNNWKGLGTFFDAFGQKFKSALGPELQGSLSKLVDWIGRAATAVGDLLGPVDNMHMSFAKWGAAAGGAAAAIVNGIAGIPDAVNRAGAAFVSWADQAKAGIDAAVASIASSATAAGAAFVSWADRAKAGIDSAISAAVSSVQASLASLPGIVSSATSGFVSAMTNLAQQGYSAVVNFDWAGLGSAIVQGIINGISSMASAFIGKLGEMAAAGAAKVRGMFGGAGGGGASAPSPAAQVGGARAMGGPVRNGVPYLVGERGPEIFVPSAAGRIETNGAYRRLASAGSAGGGGASAPSPAAQVGGARAMGGPVRNGVPYLVGERGPEIFVPSAAGRIETNGAYRRLASAGSAGGDAAKSAYSTLANKGMAVQGGRSVSVSKGDTTFHISVTSAKDDNAAEIARKVKAAMQSYIAEQESDQRGLLSD